MLTNADRRLFALAISAYITNKYVFTNSASEAQQILHLTDTLCPEPIITAPKFDSSYQELLETIILNHIDPEKLPRGSQAHDTVTAIINRARS